MLLGLRQRRAVGLFSQELPLCGSSPASDAGSRASVRSFARFFFFSFSQFLPPPPSPEATSRKQPTTRHGPPTCTSALKRQPTDSDEMRVFTTLLY